MLANSLASRMLFGLRPSTFTRPLFMQSGLATRFMATQPPKLDGESDFVPAPEKKLQFSAFARKPKDYSVNERDTIAKKMDAKFEQFVPKPEFSRMEFDPHVRHSLDDIDNTLIYRAIDFKEPGTEPQSMYCAVQYEGKTWHLFNAARMPLGRIASLAAGFLRGKNKPNYIHNRAGQHGDFVVVVNASDQFMTGRKRSQKIYRKYTGYVGNMKTTKMKHMLEDRPEYVLQHAIKGMIPKNKLREDVLKQRLLIYPGPYHPHIKQGLPQFTEQDPLDINEAYDFGKLVERRHNYKIIYESDPANPAEEFADVERDIDDEMDVPEVITKKTHTDPKYNLLAAKFINRNFRKFNRYKRSKS